MSPALEHCNFRCWHCWRDISTAARQWTGPIDEPKDIVDGCIYEHVKLLYGFQGNANANKKRVEQMKIPLHFAISLTGEPTMYPRLPELIDEIKRRGMTGYLVTNGSFPEMIEKLVGHEPTQFYLTLAAPNEEMFIKTTNPLTKDAWPRFNKSLQLMKDLNCRRVLRLTLTKGHNMYNPEEYGRFIKDLHFEFVELKGYVNVGYAQYRNTKENMPTHDEIKEFAEKVAKAAGLKYIDEKPESSVVLLMKEDFKGRIMDFESDLTMPIELPKEFEQKQKGLPIVN
jgi:tRNA wybutosine-synthesizing protein 1